MSAATTQASPADEATFRKRCIALARARNEQAISECLESFGESFDRDLFAKVWQEEETPYRARLRKSMWFRLFGGGVLAIASLLMFLYLFLNWGKSFPVGFVLLSHFLSLTFTAVNYFVQFKWARRRSSVHWGMARLLLRRGARVEDVGSLVDISRFPAPTPQVHEEYNGTAIKALTRLLPVAVQTDTLKLNRYQRDELRECIVSYAGYLTGKKPEAMSAESADFAAAVLLAVNALGELRGNSKEHRAVHAAVQKLAEATPLADEPVNHRYVRDLARETLPLLQAGRSAR